ncbi:hypothetical protein JCM17960_25390 [Magnetospira thiophila]
MTCRQIDIAEFDRDWLSACQQVFNDNGILYADMGSPFANPDWRVTALPGDPDEGWGLSECAQCRDLALPGQTNHFDNLVKTWERLGIRHIIGTDRSWNSADEYKKSYQAVCRAELDCFVELWEGSQYTTLLFDTTGTWGLNCTKSDDISFLAGDDRFMDTFYEVSGGEIAVRKRFDHHMIEHGNFFVRHPENPDQWVYDIIYNDILKWPQPDWIKGLPPEY